MNHDVSEKRGAELRKQEADARGRVVLLPVIAIVLGVLAACSVVGPASIYNGRGAYNAAIIATNEEQMLDVIVRLRYGETPGMLSVGSVTANVSIQAYATGQAGVGADSNYEGNLVPITGGFLYEENPTISYVPLQGEKYTRQLLSPIPIDLALLLSSAGMKLESMVIALFAEVNGLRNPAFRLDSNKAEDTRFQRLALRLDELYETGSLAFVRAAEDAELLLVISGYAPEHCEAVHEVATLLGLPARGAQDAGDILLPISLAVGTSHGSRLAVRTRSVYDLMQVAAAATEVPAEHLESGLARPFPPIGMLGSGLIIHESEERPSSAYVAVKHHGHWFYVDACDQRAKEYLRLLQALFSVRIADSSDASRAAPVLTISASR
jgi:hypothetical protein